MWGDYIDLWNDNDTAAMVPCLSHPWSTVTDSTFHRILTVMEKGTHIAATL
jgi:hypothetical protein